MKKVFGNFVREFQEALDISFVEKEKAPEPSKTAKKKEPPHKLWIPEKKKKKEEVKLFKGNRSLVFNRSLDNLLTNQGIRNLESQLGDLVIQGNPRGISMQGDFRKLPFTTRSNQYKDSQGKRYVDAIKQTAMLYNRLANGEDIYYRDVKFLIQNFYQTMVQDKNILLNLSSLRTPTDDKEYLYHHAVNVCLLSLIIPTSMGYSRSQVIEIGAAALLADVGMELVPKNIRFKKSPLNKPEMDHIHKHPVMGCQILQQIKDIPVQVYLTALQHHERDEGSGYPTKKTSELIHAYAQIISVADVYVAMTSPRPYREALIPYEAVEQVLKMAQIKKLNPQKVKSFVENISIFPVGSLVMLESGRVAKVTSSNKKDYTKPVVAVISKPNWKKVSQEEPILLDLSKTREDKIVMALPNHFVSNKLMHGF